tara:strand:+ start:4521 stop:5168 length:648 start_codon:yes stop_codon:yes gene_type:complete
MTEINRYEHGKIYKLVSPHTDKIYIGSTCKLRLCQRIAQHKYRYKEWLKDNNNYISSFRLFELGDVEIILLESVNCNTKDELLKKERDYVEKFKDIIVNKVIPTRTSKEYRKEHKEKIKEEKKEYHKEHKEEINEKHRQYYKEHKEEIIEKHRQYYEKHKEEIKEYDKQYYEKHKEEISEKQKQIYDCVCGKQSTIHHKTRHEKTKHHINFISNQ